MFRDVKNIIEGLIILGLLFVILKIIENPIPVIILAVIIGIIFIILKET